VHGSVSGVLSDGTPVVVRTAAADSSALRWFVMVLAVVVFLYAGFLVWQLLHSPGTRAPADRTPAVELDQAPSTPPAEAVAVEPVEAGSEAVDAENAAPPSQEAKRAPETKSGAVSPKPRRRRARPKSQRVAKPAPEPVKPAKKAAPPPPAPAPKADPVDIDIQNPYRN
jgi:cytoskeletal protein RodZ